MLPEVQHERLRQGNIPRGRLGKPIGLLLSRRLSTRLSRRMRLDDVVHILSRFRAVTILTTSFSGYLFEYGGLYVVQQGETLRWEADYMSQSRAPILVEIEQGLGDVRKKVEVLFAAPYGRFK
jgi:hypothetical protein